AEGSCDGGEVRPSALPRQLDHLYVGDHEPAGLCRADVPRRLHAAGPARARLPDPDDRLADAVDGDLLLGDFRGAVPPGPARGEAVSARGSLELPDAGAGRGSRRSGPGTRVPGPDPE